MMEDYVEALKGEKDVQEIAEHQANIAAELLRSIDKKELEAFILDHVPIDFILDIFGKAVSSVDDGKIHVDDGVVDDMIHSSSSLSSQLRIDTNNENGDTNNCGNNSNINVNNAEPPPLDEEAVPTVIVTDALSLPDAPPSPKPKVSSKPFKRRTPCICGDPVERWKNDAVRLRCKCLIHAQCLADHLQAALGNAFSQVSASGIRCPYFHTCKSYIGADDAAKFHHFLTTTGLQRQTEKMGPTDSTAATVATATSGGDVSVRFGTSEVSKLFKFSTAATFASSDLIYCPSCNVPFWVDEAFRNNSSNRRVVCGNEKCALTFCWLCLVPWHRDLSCEEYKIITSSNDQESQRFVVATSKPCPSCNTPLSHFHGHSCHHISPVGERGGGCPVCHVHFCFACLSTAEENELVRGDRRACKCPQGRWSSFCSNEDIAQFLVLEPYPHDSRCGCSICPDCRFQQPCGGAITTESGGVTTGDAGCDGTCVVCLGLVQPGWRELNSKTELTNKKETDDLLE